MMANAGLSGISSTQGASQSRGVPRPPARWLSRIVLPALLIVALPGVLLYAAREALLPAVEVSVVPVVARATANSSAQPNGSAPLPVQAHGVVLAQAPGWVEPEPYAVIVQSLVGGVVREVFVLDGETVEAGEIVAQLIDDDARLDLERAQAEYAMQQAALSRAQAEAAVAGARADELLDEVNRKRDLTDMGGVSKGEFARLEFRLQALLAEQNVAEAEVRAAEASARRADVMRRTSELALERTTIRTPVAGVVLARSVMPGTRISMAGGGPGEAHMPGVVSIYDPSRLQVRAEVPLADFGKIGIGTLAEVTTEALPGVTIHGTVTRIVHATDIQRNTVQVKVVLDDPPGVLKPDMLTRVRFVSGGVPVATTGGSSPSNVASTGSTELLAPTSAVVERSGEDGIVWLAAVSRSGDASVARRRQVKLGSEIEPGYVQVLAGLNPGDRLIINAPADLTEGTRIRTAERAGP
jgi:RND family efflux transporter MFP subunit